MARAIANLALGAVLAALAPLAGCGSSGGSSDGGGHGGTGGGAGGIGGAGGTMDAGTAACGPAMAVGGVATAGIVSWVDDGIAQCATLVETARATTATTDLLGVIAVSGDAAYSVDVIVSTDGVTPLGGTYSCGTTAAVSPYVILDVINPDDNGAADTCTITITSAGSATAHAQGTFSGTISGDGGSRAVTNGVFDVVVTPG